MQVVVEFAGISRMLTKSREIALDLPDNSTFRDAIKVIATRFPALVGKVLSPEGDDLYASDMLNLNGKLMVTEQQMDGPIHEGDHLIMMSILSGG